MSASRPAEPSLCPACGGSLPEPRQGVTQCPACGWQTMQVIDYEPAEADVVSFAAPEDAADSLDNARIRKIVLLRRADNRARTYCIVGAVGCVVAAVQLVINAVATAPGSRAQVGDVLFAFAAAGAAVFLGAQARRPAENRPGRSVTPPPAEFEDRGTSP